MEQFGGNISMKSKHGKGSTFTFILKLQKESINENEILLYDINNSEVKFDTKQLYF